MKVFDHQLQVGRRQHSIGGYARCPRVLRLLHDCLIFKGYLKPTRATFSFSHIYLFTFSKCLLGLSLSQAFERLFLSSLPLSTLLSKLHWLTNPIVNHTQLLQPSRKTSFSRMFLACSGLRKTRNKCPRNRD